MRTRSMAAVVLTSLLAMGTAAAGVIVVVDDASDVLHSPGCATTGTGTCTLRDAITFANSNPGADTVHFAIGGSGVHTIALTSDLPPITDPLTIDGYTQAGSAPNTNGPGLGDNAVLHVEINASGVGNGADTGALTVGPGGGGTTIKGLAINRYVVNGIALVNSGGGNFVEGNYIGINPAGNAASTIVSSASGIEIRGFNGFAEDGDVIGGTAPAARNVIAGNNGGGQINFPGGSQSGHQILNNFIGTNAAGTASLSIAGCASSAQSGIRFGETTTGVSIGDGTAAGRNLISGNCARGISMGGSTVASNTIAGNFIGTDVTGTMALGNQAEAISLFGVGATTITGNVISAAINTASNGEGIDVGNMSGPVTIQGNKIGTDVTGTADLGNQGVGILISNSNGTVVGGTGAGEGNVVAFNGCCQLGGQPGILIASGTGNSIRGNSIFSNNHIGIDLSGDGVTLNDDCDADGGADNLQNFPVITTVSAAGGSTTIHGTLDSKASTKFQIDFYSSVSCDPSGYGEGQTYLGSKDVTTDAFCHATFTAVLPVAVPAAARVTATATDPSGNTSEFSLCAAAIPETLAVDPTAGPTSDGDGVLEPGETVAVEPGWKNPTTLPLAVTGVASGLAGPSGAGYAIPDASADYGSISPGATGSCHATGNCYSMFVSSPAVRPATHWDAAFTETLNLTNAVKDWKLHVGDSFTDVPRSYPFYRKIETIFHNAITVGCNTTMYCPTDKVPRSQMAIFIARGIAGGGANVPVSGIINGKAYNCVAGGTSLFTDVSPTDIFCKSVHYMAAQNVTTGCAVGLYCPADLVSRTQMAIFIAKGIVAPGGGTAVPMTYGPDPVTGFSYSCDPGSPNLFFTDVSTSDSFCKHVHFLWAKGIIAGCSANQYCPTLNVGRDEMSKFLANAFALQLYGP